MGTSTFTAVSSVYYNVTKIKDASGSWNAMMYAGQVNGSQRCGAKFNLSGLTNKTITKATLRLYYERGGAPFDVFDLAASNTLDFTTYGSGSGETLINDSNAISNRRALGITTDLVGWRDVDVTDMISQMYSSKVCFYILLKDSFYDTQNGFLRFSGAAKETRPQLILEWRENASTFTTNKDVVVIGSNGDFKVTINAADSSYKHRVYFALGSNDMPWPSTSAYYTGGGTFTGEIVKEYANQLPNSTSGAGTVRVVTYDSSGKELGTVTKSVSYSVPNSDVFRPTIDGLYIVNNPNGTNYANYTTWNSGVTAPSAKYGARVVETKISLINQANGAVVFSTSGTTSLNNIYTPAQAAGTYTWEIKITDSRGFSTIKNDLTSVVEAYTPIYISGLSITRTDANGSASVEGVYYKLGGFANSSHNITSVKIDGTTVASNTGVKSYSFSNISPQATNQAASYAKTITISVSDGIKTISQNITLPSAQYILYFKKGGTALGIGKAADTTPDGWLDIGWNTAITNTSSGYGMLRLSSPATSECSIYFYPSKINNVEQLWALGTGCNGLGSDSFTLYSQNAQRNIFTTTASNAHFYGYSFTVSNPTAVTRVTQIPANGYVSIFADNEGGNIEIRSTDDYKRFYQFDAEGGSLRCFSHHIKTDNTDSDHDTTGFTYDGATGNVYIGNLSIGTLSSPLGVSNGGTGGNNATDARANLGIYSKAETDNIASYYSHTMKTYNNSPMGGMVNLQDLTIAAGSYWLEFDGGAAANNSTLPPAIKSLSSDRCAVTIWVSFHAPASTQYRIVEIYSFTKKKFYRMQYWWDHWDSSWKTW